MTLPGTASPLNMMYISPKLAVDVFTTLQLRTFCSTDPRGSANVSTLYNGYGYLLTQATTHIHDGDS